MVGDVEPAVTVEGVSKRYGDIVAADGISLEVHKGEVFGVLGPNGAGKTTLLEIIEGLREPDLGRVRVLGEDPHSRRPSFLRRIGVQLQRSAFFERLTAREQLRLFVRLYGAPDCRVAQMLELVGLEDKAGSQVEKLSGGQVQRLALACAIAHQPELVFLDEPTGGLDPQARRNIWDVIKAIRSQGHTVMLTTHYLDEAEELCDRVAIIDHGRILVLGEPEALVRQTRTPVEIVLPADALSIADARGVDGVDEAVRDGSSLRMRTAQPSQVLEQVAERDLLDGIEVERGSLEDVFLELTGREYRE